MWSNYRSESSLRKMFGSCLRLVARDMLRFCGSRHLRRFSPFPLAPAHPLTPPLSLLPPASGYDIHLPFIFPFFAHFYLVCASSYPSFSYISTCYPPIPVPGVSTEFFSSCPTSFFFFVLNYLRFSPSAFNQVSTFLHQVSYRKHRGMISTRDNSYS